MVFCLCGARGERWEVDGVCGRGAHGGVGSFEGVFDGRDLVWRGLKVLNRKGSGEGMLTNQSHACDI